MRRTSIKICLLFFGLLLFGALDALVKGNHGGTRDAIGNVSAPWVLLPFLSGVIVSSRRTLVSATTGVLSTAMALACYSLVRDHVRNVSGSQHHTSSLLSGASNRWFLLGVVGGAVLGALGSWLMARRRYVLTLTFVSGVLVFEPIARISWALRRGEPAGTLIPNPVIWISEVLMGVLVTAIAIAYWQRRHSPLHE